MVTITKARVVAIVWLLSYLFFFFRSDRWLRTKSVEPNNNEKTTMSGQYPQIRLICISDTHSMHRNEYLTKKLHALYQSENDILLHAGDFSNSGSQSEIYDVDQWFGSLPYQHIFVVSGNMDGIGLDGATPSGHEQFKHAVYLEHEQHTLRFSSQNGNQLSIFGSPYTLPFVGGFQLQQNEVTQNKLWSQIPNGTDVVLCHGPPKHILDETSSGSNIGDAVFKKHIVRVKPKVVVFGHVHYSHGVVDIQENDHAVTMVNAAMYDQLRNSHTTKNVEPVVIELPWHN